MIPCHKVNLFSCDSWDKRMNLAVHSQFHYSCVSGSVVSDVIREKNSTGLPVRLKKSAAVSSGW